MIEKIILRNFLSFKDETVFDFSASLEKPKAGFDYLGWYEDTNSKKILKNLFLFGNNGTGKSNFIYAIDTLRNLVCRNPRSKTDEQFLLPDFSFKLSEYTKSTPSYIGIVFSIGDTRYTYEVEWNRKSIILEKLEKKQDRTRTQCVFSRTFDADADISVIEFPSKTILPEVQSIIKENAIKNASVISVYDSVNVESKDLKDIYTYFKSIRIIPCLEELDLMRLLEDRKDGEKLKSILLSLLRDLGSNIIDYQIDQFEIKIDEMEAKLMRNYLGEDRFNKEFPNGTRKAKAIRFGHPTDMEGKIGWLRENEESLGTLNMIKLIIALYDCCTLRSPILIDECSYGIHQQTFGRIIQFFLSLSQQSQAILATQNLSVMDMEGFRRDTIRIFDKNRITGETFCKKVDLRKYHKNLNIVRAYLDNSFGSLPEFPTNEEWVKHLTRYKELVSSPD